MPPYWSPCTGHITRVVSTLLGIGAGCLTLATCGGRGCSGLDGLADGGRGDDGRGEEVPVKAAAAAPATASTMADISAYR